MNKDNAYGWIITWVNDSFLDEDEIGINGPRNTPFTPEELKAGQVFHMYDDDGELYYKGRSLGTGEYEDSEEYFAGPLDDFGGPNAGCTAIKHRDEKTGKMEYVIG